ncbi:MAG: hypothetical protein HQ581_16865 [Planctomycetes bacterium]|nr:hypothetical protein [Planctomycetota bacterium]
MNKKTLLAVVCLLAAMAMVVGNVAAQEKINTDPKQQLPAPDAQAAAMDKPVQVFILLGQSNMLGFGRIDPEDQNGTLSHAVKQQKKYPHLIDDAGKYPEFKGNVAAIDARPFWRDSLVSPSGAGYHYNHNAETHMEVGNLLGWAMAEMLGKQKD